ncbi:hypothetical protein B296_00003383 [Ensete ventricosum]|uniref:Uncharacterized protein n=1 Tax=Ensete ventricosum TaxID=4639 RepID=A0A427B5D6_ENSVE|nr:hypothetical protein B296_00003383 [Ensete ventricosum]
MLLRLGRSVDLKGNERSAAVIDLLSFDSEKELVAPSLQNGIGKVPLLVRADAIVVVHREDDLVQKHTSVEELRKPTGFIRGRESRLNKSPTEEEKADALEVFSFNIDERLSFNSKKR